jgi:hypothetical protein
MKFTTLIPTRFNDGKPVPKRQQRAIIDRLVRRFGGCTEEGLAKGQWIDPAKGVLYRDECERVSVVCDRIQLDEARATIIEIGAELGQRAMYFEVRDYDGVQILEVPYVNG